MDFPLFIMCMVTLKVKYDASEEDKALIRKYRRQYSSLLHFIFNRMEEGCTPKEAEEACKMLNNVELMDSWFVRSARYDAQSLLKARTKNEKVIFGGRKNLINRCKGKVTKEEFVEKRLSPLCSIGEAMRNGNRKFRMNPDCSSFTFQPKHGLRLNLTLTGSYRLYGQTLRRLYELQESKGISVTYAVDGEFLYITYDETVVDKPQAISKIQDRIFSIDLNPNYVGWSVTDWKLGNSFSVVDSGTISIKEINDMDFTLKPRKLPSDSKERLYVNSKRHHEVFEIAKLLVVKALHYKCSLFAMEDLSIKSSDKGKGKRFNSLCNRMWNRDKMVQNIEKRCRLSGIELLKVKANYSSFVGNFLFRKLRLPDMTLASVEIARRGYEYNHQYILKDQEIRRNIVMPCVADFANAYAESLEEFGVEEEFRTMTELYEYLKKTGCRYRLSVDEMNLRFSRRFSRKSLVSEAVLGPRREWNDCNYLR